MGAEVATGVLLDAGQDAALAADGYVVVPGVLGPDVVAQLIERYQAIVPEGDHGITVDYMRPDRTVIRALTELLAPVWSAHLPAVFTGHRPVMSTFVVKHPGVESGMFLHEDRSYVDERRARAFSVWIPLCPVGPDRQIGTLEVVPRSHLLPVGPGGSLTPDHARPYERFLRERLVPLHLDAGDAVVYDTRLLHASGPNLTDHARIAVVCAVAPEGEPLIHVVATGATARRVHAVTPAFFVEHHPREIEVAMPDDCPVVAEFDDPSELSPEAVAAVFGVWPERDPVVPVDVRRDGDPEHLPTLEVVDAVPSLRPDLTGVRHRVVQPGVAVDESAGRIVLAPGSRLELVADGPGPVQVLTTVAPPVGAGVRDGRAAVELVPGRAVILADDEPMLCWNDGPGDVELLVSRPRRRWWGRRR
jgi:hypothetical protein